MREDGYFEPASDLKPLLHTWSLAVEEQYYIFFPLLMVVLMRQVRHWRWMLFAVLLISFGLNIAYIDRKPDVAFSRCRHVPGSCCAVRCSRYCPPPDTL